MEDYKKKYEDALNVARKFKNDCPLFWNTKSNPFRDVFEELEDNDERIRKEIIHILKGKISYTSKEDADKYIAWLEKQGEQKLLNNDKYQTVSVKILDRLYESEKELERLKQGEQKPVWSEEDEKMLQEAISSVTYACFNSSSLILWLKSLKERMIGE